MIVTKKQLRQIISEELNRVLSEEEGKRSDYEKVIDLMSKNYESLGVALSLFDSLEGTGAFQEVEEEHLLRLIPYASAVYEYKSLSDEMSSMPRRSMAWKVLKKKRAAAKLAYLEAQDKINAADKAMIAQATDVY